MSAHAEGHGNPHLAHHFEDIHQQQEAHTLGMWTFLATEIMFFGGLFLAFIVYHILYPEAFILGSQQLGVGYGGINTFFLILSSLTMALAVHAAQVGKQKMIRLWLLATIALAFAFIAVKTVEWTDKYKHHLIPGTSFSIVPALHNEPGVEPTAKELSHYQHQLENYNKAKLADPLVDRHVQIFFLLYFVMTGLHGIHVVIGIGILIWIYWKARQGEFHEQWNTPVELTGLYWHFVDLVWIYLFPVIYLIHRH